MNTSRKTIRRDREVVAALYPPLEGEGRRECNERRGGVTVSPFRTVPMLRDHPTPPHMSLRSMGADPPPPGEGEGGKLGQPV